MMPYSGIEPFIASSLIERIDDFSLGHQGHRSSFEFAPQKADLILAAFFSATFIILSISLNFVKNFLEKLFFFSRPFSPKSFSQILPCFEHNF
jgi:hypothetical protein